MAGCHCKKSRCLKKYCECFEGSVYCGPNCKCVECQNVVDSEALKQVKIYGNVKEKKDRSSQLKVELSDGSDCDASNPRYNTYQQRFQQQQHHQVNPISSTLISSKNTRNIIIPSRDLILSDRLSNRVLSTQIKIEKKLEEVEKTDEQNIQEVQKQENKEEAKVQGNTNQQEVQTPQKSKKKNNEITTQQQNQESQQLGPVYPFFGQNNHPTTKLIALSCLQYLDGPSLYSLSCVNHLWNQAVMDDALWE